MGFLDFLTGGGDTSSAYNQLNQTARDYKEEAENIARSTGGIRLGITGADQQEFDKSFGHFRDMILRSLQQDLPGILEQAGGQVGVRGLGGQEAQSYIQNANAQIRGQQSLDQLSQFGAMQAGQLAGFSNNRVQQQLQRNQLLWQQMTGAYAPLMQVQGLQGQARVNDRMANQQAIGGIIGAGASLIPGIPGL